MAVLGKRKAPEPTISTEDAQEIFRRHFEAQFLPLQEEEHKARKVRRTDDDEDDEDDSDGSGSGSGEGEWGGLSGDEESNGDEDDDDEVEEEDDGKARGESFILRDLFILTPQETPAIEVVDHSVSQAPNTSTMSKRELKAFMVSSPPYHSFLQIMTKF
jgi:hypothetical protein